MMLRHPILSLLVLLPLEFIAGEFNSSNMGVVSRLLRGGGGGGGTSGGGYSGGGAYIQSGNTTGGPFAGSTLLAIVIVGVIGLVLAGLCCGCVMYSHREKKRKKDFESELARQRANFAPETTNVGGVAVRKATPVSGKYKGSYHENGKTCFLEMYIRFDTQPKGLYKINGSGADSDGPCRIVEGMVGPDGQAYWLEASGSRQVLTLGTFDFRGDNTLFEGRWMCDNGTASPYAEFKFVAT